MSDEKHVYDGIVEENNPMPDWWVWLFIGTVIFGFIYWLHYQVGGGTTQLEEYNNSMAAFQQRIEKNAVAAVDTEESLSEYMKNEAALMSGKSLFADKCAMCHGNLLEGKIGPNLTDRYWIHGKGSRMDLVEVIRKGVPEKGMPPWEGLLKPLEVKNVAAYVFANIGTEPPGAKAPEGNKSE